MTDRPLTTEPVAHAAPGRPGRTVLVALDDTDVSHRVAEFVNSFFDPVTTHVVAVNVSPVPVPWIPDVAWGGVWLWGWPVPTSDAVYATSDEERERAEHQAEADAMGTVEASGLHDAEVVVEHGEPSVAIQAAAEEHHADLIVVGTRDQGAIQRLLFGSVSQDLVRHADRPVLVVR